VEQQISNQAKKKKKGQRTVQVTAPSAIYSSPPNLSNSPVNHANSSCAAGLYLVCYASNKFLASIALRIVCTSLVSKQSNWKQPKKKKRVIPVKSLGKLLSALTYPIKTA